MKWILATFVCTWAASAIAGDQSVYLPPGRDRGMAVMSPAGDQAERSADVQSNDKDQPGVEPR